MIEVKALRLAFCNNISSFRQHFIDLQELVDMLQVCVMVESLAAGTF
jgi:hypothetical protein